MSEKKPIEEMVADLSRVSREKQPAEIRTPYDDKIAEAARMLRGEEKPAYLPFVYKIEGVDLAEPEPWPKENPNLTPEQIGRAQAELENIAQTLTEILTPIAEKLTEYLMPIAKRLADVMKRMIDLYPNKHVIYLATHGKPRRRKKNMKRILKYFERQAKKAPYLAQN